MWDCVLMVGIKHEFDDLHNIINTWVILSYDYIVLNLF